MKPRSFLLALAVFLAARMGLAAEPGLTLPTQFAEFTVSREGSLGAILRKADGRNYLAPGQPAPLLSIRVGGKLQAPDTARWDAEGKRLTLRYAAAGATAVLGAEAKPTHVVFEVVELQPAHRVELVLWGPYPTTIAGTIGEVVGVVRDAEFALGIQALNAKTLGGQRAAAGEDHFRRATRCEP